MATVHLRVLHCLLAVCFAGTLGAKSGTAASAEVFSPHAREIAIELARCPCWTQFRADEVEFRAGITKLYLRLAKFPKPEIREGIQAYISIHRSDLFEETDAEAKTFAFLRVVFKIPPGGIANAKAGRIATYGNPTSNGILDVLWPFSLDKSGNLELTGVALTDYGGPRFDPLGQFDVFAEMYPLRNQ